MTWSYHGTYFFSKMEKNAEKNTTTGWSENILSPNPNQHISHLLAAVNNKCIDVSKKLYDSAK